MHASDDRRHEAAVVEWAPFLLRADVDEPTLITAADGLQRDFLGRRDGFVRRELLRGPDGRWADLVVWRDAAAAEAARDAAGSSAQCSAYFALMRCDAADAGGMRHLQRVRVYAGGDDGA